MLDLDVMKQVIQDLYASMVAQQHGNEGATTFRKLLESLHQIYRHVEPETIADRFVVFKTLDASARPLPITDAIRAQRVDSLAQDIVGPAVIQVLDNDEMLVWRRKNVQPKDLADQAVVYEYHDRSEYFFAKSERRQVPRPSGAHASAFAIPTFSDLRTALDYYRTKLARVSTCKILNQAWSDESRLFFAAKPERLMRDSLNQFLHSTLRNAEVRPEQAVDESHPVDIKVTWIFNNRLALIEIKWLGDSKGTDGNISTSYTPSRANDGAQQLAEYLDWNRERAPNHITRGYLVIFDARRRGLNKNSTKISRSDGMHYEVSEISFAPEFHRSRNDFDQPVRMFIEPKCA